VTSNFKNIETINKNNEILRKEVKMIAENAIPQAYLALLQIDSLNQKRVIAADHQDEIVKHVNKLQDSVEDLFEKIKMERKKESEDIREIIESITKMSTEQYKQMFESGTEPPSKKSKIELKKLRRYRPYQKDNKVIFEIKED